MAGRLRRACSAPCSSLMVTRWWLAVVMVQVVGEGYTCSGHLEVEKPRLWWPHLMSDTPGHMMEVVTSPHSPSSCMCMWRTWPMAATSTAYLLG